MRSRVVTVTARVLSSPLFVLFALFVSFASSCGGDPAAQDVTPSVSADALTSAAGAVTSGPLTIGAIAAARPVITTDERRHLVYELVVHNVGAVTVPIAGVDVSDPDRRNSTLASYRGDALAAILPADGVATAGLPPGGTTFVFIDLSLPLGSPLASSPAPLLPRRLAHTITIGQGAALTRLTGPQVPVRDDDRPALSPPLRAENLLDLNGCCTGGHGRAVFPTSTGFAVAQRYAIDFVRLTEEGTFSGDPTLNQSYFLFGADVLAAAPGRIVEAVDGLPENVPTQPLPPFQIETAAGNHIIEALDDGRFALYAHMQTGSVRGAVGARVGRGQVLGLVGNTGNSTEPHLHFHVTDAPSVLLSNGLPYVFDRFDLVATIDFGAADPEVTLTPAPQGRRCRLPMNGGIVTFH